MKKTLLSLMLGLPWLMVACSTATEPCTNVNQDRIHQALSASYSAEENTTSVSAGLRFGDSTGTTLEMTGNCAIAHDTLSLTKNSILGTSYTASKAGQINAHTFTFTDNDKKTFANTGTITAVAFARTPPSTISKATAVTIDFSDALAADETMAAYIYGDSSKSASAFTSTDGATSVEITVNDMKNLVAGSAKLHLERSKSSSLTEATAVGGSFRVSYTTAKQTVTITE